MDGLFGGSDDERGAEEAESSRSDWEAFRVDLPVLVEAGWMAGCKWIGSRDWDGQRRGVIREFVGRGVKMERVRVAG